MQVLALDSSGLVASVALINENTVIAEYSVNYKKTHSQTLLPMVDEIVKMTETNLEDIDFIAIAKGPGSFTGLRIGAATAKGLGLALNKSIVGVPTVDSLAYNLLHTDNIICPLMDARRNQVYTGIYESRENKLIVLKEQSAMSIEEIINELNEIKRNVIFIGEGADVYKGIIEQNSEFSFEYGVGNINRQRASSVGLLAIEYYKKGESCSAAEFTPCYLRLSQAERELAEKEKGESN